MLGVLVISLMFLKGLVHVVISLGDLTYCIHGGLVGILCDGTGVACTALYSLAFIKCGDVGHQLGISL